MINNIIIDIKRVLHSLSFMLCPHLVSHFRSGSPKHKADQQLLSFFPDSYKQVWSFFFCSPITEYSVLNIFIDKERQIKTVSDTLRIPIYPIQFNRSIIRNLFFLPTG